MSDDARRVLADRVRVRTGNDPRWRRFGNVTEMGVMTPLRWAAWLAGVGVQPRLVPSEYWAQDATETGEVSIDANGREEVVVAPVAVVACPCGEQPAAVALAMPVTCACERVFFFDGEHVYCFNTPPSDGATIVAPCPTESTT